MFAHRQWEMNGKITVARAQSNAAAAAFCKRRTFRRGPETGETSGLSVCVHSVCLCIFCARALVMGWTGQKGRVCFLIVVMHFACVIDCRFACKLCVLYSLVCSMEHIL